MPKIQGGNRTPSLVKTASYTLTSDDLGKTLTNQGAAGTITVTLPAAEVGMKFRFYLNEAQELRIDPNGTETIALPSTGAQGAAGKYLVADAIGEWVDIECLVAGTWDCLGFAGTWTAEG
jgi:hypothetical protein